MQTRREQIYEVSEAERLFFIVTDARGSGSASVTKFFSLADEKRADL
ncbi:hypothetical protein [Paenibacillus sp. Soil724D2]|nr:hypothetical protein [Paenibacillus sp. Soil724D2]